MAKSPSPMSASGLHDKFVLLDGAKQIRIPGLARVTAGLKYNADMVNVPGDGTKNAQLTEAGGEVRVSLIMTTEAEWAQYQHVLTRLRRGTVDGPSVFTCAHPEVRARRIRRLYFVSEQMDAPYSAREGYRVSITFQEQIKVKAPVMNLEDGLGVSGESTTGVTDPTQAGGGDSPAASAEGKAIYDSALKQLITKPAPLTRDGKTPTSWPGYCSSWARVVWKEATGSEGGLFGGTANDTASRFRQAGLFTPWSANALDGLRAGDLVFYPPTAKVPQGHVGVYDGKGGVLGNNYVTYQQRGGLFSSGVATGYDSQGRPVDARGVVPIMGLGNPSGFARPKEKAKPTPSTVIGPSQNVQLPPNRPSANVPLR